MLKDIRIHLAAEEAEQERLEQALSRHIVSNHRRSIMAFARHIPSLLPEVQNVATENIAIFANKNGEYNIVDYGTGRTVYGLTPQAEILQQYQNIKNHAPFIALHCDEKERSEEGDNSLKSIAQVADLPGYRKQIGYSALPQNVNVMVVMGLGLGYHIEQLVKHHNISHLIIYEPERQYFQCSVLALDWQRLLQTMEAKGTAVFLLLEKDGRDLIENITELTQHVNVDGFYYYKHYNHAIFDRLEVGLRDKSWSQLSRDGFDLTPNSNPNLFLPVWSGSIELEMVHSVDKSDTLFNRNLSAFKKYFPDIYKEFAAYCPTDWLPVRNEHDEINLIQKQSLAPFGGKAPRQDADESFNHFKRFPQKDGLVLGYTGTKLKRYKHYQFVEKTESLLNDIAEEAGQLPATVKSLIMFGIGLGYQVEALFKQRRVEKLFLCEPNRDFFYASLYAIDWHSILNQADKDNCRIYINIGDDGSHLFRDLLAQFYSIGPYILASTYFYQAYYNAHLVHALAQLREQLQIVISMGEYFDHALYGISHTIETINRGYPLLEANPAKKLSLKQKETPVFLIGNGPSLDDCLATIKEWQGRAIVVSCGTALMPLYKNGIIPDFHAEIEQNRSTFDWVSRIADFDFLKRVSLLSCNGIHPDTCDLFKEVFVAFKSGESSTVSSLNIIGRAAYEELDYAFPTVSNFALNLFIKIGFNQIYLFGVDLGFTDRKKHHSIQSGYYESDGEEMYDYSEKNNTSIVVPGNFEKTVFTKHEFKVSKDILEQTLSNKSLDCFNCSNGAKIKDTLPLKCDDVLLVSTEEDASTVVEVIKRNVFKPVANHRHYIAQFAARYRQDILLAELDHLLALINEPIVSVEEVNTLIEKQKNTIFESYKNGSSLLFYLLYGSMNYCNVLLSKCENIKQEETLLNYAEGVLQQWSAFLAEVKELVHHLDVNFDTSESFGDIRQVAHLKRFSAKTVYLTNIHQEHIFNQFKERFFTKDVIEIKVLEPDSLETLQLVGDEAIRFAFLVNSQKQVDHLIDVLNASSLTQGHVFWFSENVSELDFSGLRFSCSIVVHPDFVYGPDGLRQIVEGSAAYWVEERMPYVALKYNFQADYSRVVVPKVKVRASAHHKTVMTNFYYKVVTNTQDYSHYLDFGEYLVFASDNDLRLNLTDMAGNRAGLFSVANLTADTLLEAEICNDVLESIYLTYDAGKAGGSYN
ncbi:6-hydroxymethylpterin diphosphokinase MptE-like protein [uncultured Alteromonas sp.]|jgi:hypothetical protein|uniref:motility associated factor glycosyltransferase family protein n=1 Tax=uncultured Alteromonas sp. TaxID=179113 RepID=UPI0025FE3022|nr:6-hydroxymethylpterin diphosphokinase MptE-like protein [uncultured Alteromonas sp.]